jgi:chromosome partitioning protein
MRSMALLSQKGGSGKTTLAVHLAVAAAATCERVLLLDADPQGSACAWSHARSQSRTHAQPLVEKATAQTLARALEHAQHAHMTLAVIDSAPHAVPGIDTIATTADLLVIPCRPSAFDLAALAASVQVAKAAGTPTVFVLNACPPRAPEIEETKDVLTAYGFPVAPICLGDRRAFARAIASGQAVTEFEAHGKAAQEITQLWTWVHAFMTF